MRSATERLRRGAWQVDLDSPVSIPDPSGMLIEHTLPDWSVFALNVSPASFGPQIYEPYAEEALRYGVIMVRVIGDEGEELFRRSRANA